MLLLLKGLTTPLQSQWRGEWVTSAAQDSHCVALDYNGAVICSSNTTWHYNVRVYVLSQLKHTQGVAIGS